jgi:hypothetical protein
MMIFVILSLTKITPAFCFEKRKKNHGINILPKTDRTSITLFLLPSGKTVFESAKKRPEDKRKRLRNDDPGDIEGYLGPWGKFVDEKTVMKPDEVRQHSSLVFCIKLCHTLLSLKLYYNRNCVKVICSN